MTRKAARILVHGRVQGVGFRYFCAKRAGEYGLSGWTKNRLDGSVEVWVEGTAIAIENLIDDLRRGPSNARVESLDISYGAYSGNYHTFEITH